MKMELARPEPSCGTTEASADLSGIQHRPGKASISGKLIRRSCQNWYIQDEAIKKVTVFILPHN